MMLQRIGPLSSATSMPQVASLAPQELSYPIHPQLRRLPEEAFLRFGEANILVQPIISRSEYHYATLELAPKHSYVVLPQGGRVNLPTLTWKRIELFSYITRTCQQRFSSCAVEGFYSGGAALKILFGEEAYPKVSDVDVKVMITTHDPVMPSMIPCMVMDFFGQILSQRYPFLSQYVGAYFSKEDIHTVVYSSVLLATVAIGQDDWTLQFRSHRMYTVAAKSWLLSFDKPYALVLEGTAQEACEDVALGRIRTHSLEGLLGKGVFSLWDLMTQGWFPASSVLHQSFLIKGEEASLARPTLLIDYSKSHRENDWIAQIALMLTVYFDFYGTKRQGGVLCVLRGMMTCWREDNADRIGEEGVKFFDACLKDLDQAWCWLQWYLLLCKQEVGQAVPRREQGGNVFPLCVQGYGYYPLRGLISRTSYFQDEVYLSVKENFEFLWERVDETLDASWSFLQSMPSLEEIEALGTRDHLGDTTCLWNFLFGDAAQKSFLYPHVFGAFSIPQAIQGLEKMKSWMQRFSKPVGGVELRIVTLQLLAGSLLKEKALPRFWDLLGQVPCVTGEKRNTLLLLLQAIARVAHIEEEAWPFHEIAKDAAVWQFLCIYYTSLQDRSKESEKQVVAHFSKIKTRHAEMFYQEVPSLIYHLLQDPMRRDLGELLLTVSDGHVKRCLIELVEEPVGWEIVAGRLSRNSLEDMLLLAKAFKSKVHLLKGSQPVWIFDFLVGLIQGRKRKIAARIANQAYGSGLLLCQIAWTFLEILQPSPGSSESVLVEAMCLDLCQQQSDHKPSIYPWLWRFLCWSFECATDSKLLSWMKMHGVLSKVVRKVSTVHLIASFYARCALVPNVTSVQLQRLGAFLVSTWIQERGEDQAPRLLQGLWEGLKTKESVKRGVIAQPLFDRWCACSDLLPEIEITWLYLARECGQQYLIPVIHLWRRRKRFELCLAQAVQVCACDVQGIDLVDFDECLLWVMRNLAEPKQRQGLAFIDQVWWAKKALKLGQKLPVLKLQAWCQEVLSDPCWQGVNGDNLISDWCIFVTEAVRHQWLDKFLQKEEFVYLFLDSCSLFQDSLEIQLLEQICRLLECLRTSCHQPLLRKAESLCWLWAKKWSYTVSRRECIERLLSIHGGSSFSRPLFRGKGLLQNSNDTNPRFCHSSGLITPSIVEGRGRKEVVRSEIFGGTASLNLYFSSATLSQFCLELLLRAPLSLSSDLDALMLYLDYRNVSRQLATEEEAEQIAVLLRNAFQFLGKKEEAFVLWKLAIHLQTSQFLPNAEVREAVLVAAKGMLEHWKMGPRILTQDLLFRLTAEHKMPVADYSRYAFGHQCYRELVILLQGKDLKAAMCLRWEVFKLSQNKLFQDVIALTSRACPSLSKREWAAAVCVIVNYGLIYLFASALHSRRET